MKRLPRITDSGTRVHPTRDLMADVRPSDFAALARLWNESDPGWPGGFGHGRETAAAMRRGHEESPSMAVYVTQTGRRLLAYCSLWRRPGQNRTAYVGLLNSHPAFHGKGHGKSVMLAAVDRVTHDGFDVLELHTWPGNEKALRVYERTGFRWVPGREVFMQNFIPHIRRSAVGRLFFAKRDWYATYRREVTFRPDEVRRDGRFSFEYLFRGADGELLRFVFDKESELPVEIETDRFLVSIRHRGHEPVAGTDQQIRLRVVNKTGEPIAARFAAGGDPAVKIRYRRQTAVRRGFSDGIDFTIRPEAPRKFGDPRALLAWVDATIDGLPMRLAVGMKPKAPLDVRLDGAPEFVSPGERLTLKVKLESRLKVPCRVTGRITAAGGRLVKAITLNKRLKASGKATVSVPVTAGKALTLSLRPTLGVVLADRVLRPRIEPLDRAICSDVACGGWIGPTQVGLVGPTARLTLRRWGWGSGGVAAHSALTGEAVVGLSPPRLGPPFEWVDFFDGRADVALSAGEGCATAVLSGRSCFRPALELRREITLFADGLIRVRDRIHNHGPRALRLHSRYGAGRAAGAPRRWAAPTPEGVMLEEPGQLPRPFGWPNRPVETLRWPEPWLAAEARKGGVGGVIWPACFTAIPGGWNAPLGLSSPSRRLRAGETTRVGEIHLIATTGDWRVIGAWWKRLDKAAKAAGKKKDAAAGKPRHRPPVDVQVTPGGNRPLWLPAGRGRAELIASVASHHLVDVQVDAPKDGPIRFRPRRITWKQIVGPGHRSARVTVTAASAPPGVQTVELVARQGVQVQRKPVTVIVPQRRRPVVRVQEGRGGVWRLANGLLRLQVAPQFGGAMVSLRRKGVEWLDSPFPEVGMHPWFNPWFGGVSPMLARFSQRLHLGRFEAGRVRLERDGVQFDGLEIRWRARAVDKEKRRLTVRYLLARGVPVVRCELEAAGRGKANVDLRVFGRGLRATSVRTYTDRVANGHLLGAKQEGEGQDLRWVLSEEPETGRTLCVAVADERGKITAHLPGWPAETASLSAELQCGRKVESRTACWIVPCLDLAEGREWAALAGRSLQQP